jgi:hypothetical protein
VEATVLAVTTLPGAARTAEWLLAGKTRWIFPWESQRALDARAQEISHWTAILCCDNGGSHHASCLFWFQRTRYCQTALGTWSPRFPALATVTCEAL